MKSKILSLISLSILSLVLALSFASALAISGTTFSGNQSTLTVTTNATDSGTVSLTASGLSLSFNESSFAVSGAGTRTILATVQNDTDDLDYGVSYSTVVNASNGTNSAVTGSLTYTKPFYTGNNQGRLKIEITDISTDSGFGDDESFWYPFDKVEVEVEITNDGSHDIENVEVVWELYTTAGKKISDDTEDDFDLDENDDTTLTLIIDLDENVDDMEGEDLILYISAIGKINDKDSVYDNDETGVWTSTLEEFPDLELITNDNFVLLGDLDVNGVAVKDSKLENSVSCGTDLLLEAEIWNVGDDKQKDVTVLIRNTELGISKSVEMDDINSFDYEKLVSTVSIPENAEPKTYDITFLIYDDDSDLFETDEDNDKAIFNIAVKVEGNCIVARKSAITAALDSETEAKSGEPLSVKTTIENIDSKVATYTISVSGYESWATLEDFTKTLTLVAGESRELTLNFNVNEGVSGNKMFNIETASGDSVTTQPVSISIAPQNSLIGGLSLPKNSLYLWGIGALNVLLIFAIIVVAIKLSRE